ncbi:MFS sugar transporter-like protein [Chaetomidium leptoderma]|uniref:MFS sugar transporter-like protein n=1 Tax=Chaetomidium leptoderma TaxID=669021 RepID=A0AAN6VE98_9PEZI|nr:MFS sugar transporter-like protein [Chaetomidium leptoderma]
MGKAFNICLAVFAATGSFLFGYDSGVMTDVIASHNFLEFFNTNTGSPIIGAINSTFSGGAVFGSLMGGLTMDRYGRRKTIMIGALIALVGAILQAAAQNLAMILVGRIVAGWAVGLMSMSVPVYQSECAHPKIRGLIVGLSQQMIGVGFIISTWVGYGSSFAGGGLGQFQWRFPLAFQAIPALILVCGIMFFPESPRHLMEIDREDEAMRVLRKLHFDGTNDDWIQREFHEIKTTIAAEKAITVPGWRIMFTVPQWRTRLMHGVAVQVFTQFTGINVIGYYQTQMYNALGITGNRALLVAGIYNCVGPLANLVFIVFIIDRVGRRRPLLWGTVAIIIALICESAINSRIDKENPNHALSIGGVFFLFCVTVIFSWSWGPISWTYMAEIMPMPIRARGNAFATGIGNWLVSTFWSQLSPMALKALDWKFYFLFVAFDIVVTLPIVFFFFKETKQLSLEEIDLLFGERSLGTLPNDLHKEDNLHPEQTEEKTA